MLSARHVSREVLRVSDAWIDPSPHEDKDPDLDWLSDRPRPAVAPNSAIWPTDAVEMVSLPGFTLDDESVLVPLPSATADDAQAPGGEDSREASMGRPAGRRIHLVRPGVRTGAAAGVVGSVLLTVAVISGGVRLPSFGDPAPAQKASAPAAAPAPPTVAVGVDLGARVQQEMKKIQARQVRQDAARERARKRAAARRERERERSTPAPTPSPTPAEAQVSSPPAPARSAPVDPWAGVPGAVREFEPGPWNNGGQTS